MLRANVNDYTGDGSRPGACPSRARGGSGRKGWFVAKTHRVTVIEVAEAAGVSTATVVRALQGSPRVVPATRERVLEAARKLGYAPNPMARDLRGGNRVRAVGLVTADFTNAFQAAVAAGAEQELRRAGLELLIAATDDDPSREPELARTMIDRRVSALLMMPDGDDRDFLRADRTYGTPVVLVGRPAGGLDVDVVTTEDDRAVAEATDQLLVLGHRRIAALAGRSDSFRAAQRLAGYRDSLARHGLADSALVVTDLVTAAEARQAAAALLDGENPPTAVLALNLGISTGVLLDRIAGGRSCAFIGLDETEISAGLGVSAIVRDPRELGRRAAQVALERIAAADEPARTVVLPATVRRRGTGELPPT